MKTLKQTNGLVPWALFCCFLWGLAPALIKFGYSMMNISATPDILIFAGLRFSLAGFLVLLYLACRTHKFPSFTAKNLKAILIISLFQTFGQYFCYYIGVANSTGTIASIMTGMSAFFALILSSLVFHLEKMTAAKLTGCLLGFLGILVMNLNGTRFTFSLSGEGMLLASQLFSAMSAVCIQIFSKKNDPVLVSGWQFFFGGLLLILCGLGMRGHVSLNLSGSFDILLLALVSAGAYTIWGVLLSRYPVSSVGIFTCTIPLFGSLTSLLLLREWSSLNLQTLAALVLICSGVYILNSGGKNKTRKTVSDS